MPVDAAILGTSDSSGLRFISPADQLNGVAGWKLQAATLRLRFVGP